MHVRRHHTRAAALGLALSLLLTLPVAQGDAASPVAAPATTGPPSEPADPLAPVVDGEASAAGLPAPSTATTALLADFDGDHRTDLFWYGPGAKDDHLWLGRPDRNFGGVPATVRGTYLPLVGDFNGNGRADILWYGPGAARDRLWYGRGGGGFTRGNRITVRGNYKPLLGDFNGDGRRDVFWYGPGGAGDVLWYGRGGGGFTRRPVTVNGSYRPLLGDFNGDGRRDVFWYGPGAAADLVWYGRAGGFSARPVNVGRSYQPILGDFNGNGRTDILWHGPGTEPDLLWHGRTGGGFTGGRSIMVGGTYEPFTGDFDGDGRRDIFWYGRGHRRDLIWYGGASGGFAPGAVAVGGSYQPLVGDFGGDGPNDVLWWAPGRRTDVLWFGQRSRRFTSRSTTVDLGYLKALPLRRDVLVDHYDPYGFVAHAFGTINGHSYSNTLEAFRHNRRRGFRVFEADQVLLADGTVVLAHDGLEANYGLSKPFHQATWADLAGHRYLGRYTILRSHEMLRLLRDYPLSFLILDPKYDGPQIFRTYVRQAAAMGRPDLLKRILPHVADQAELDAMRAHYPLRNYLLALYHTQGENRYDDAQAVAFVRRNRTPAVMMWWRRRNASISLAANGLQRRRYRSEFARRLQAAGAVVYVHSLTSPTDIRRFWRRTIGVYSDGTFPGAQASPPALRTPQFGRRKDEASPPA
jgi:glycerophosphoryl diester phosphodiesterase